LPDITRNAQSFFKALDLNGNGFIEKDELKCVCAMLWEGDLELDREAFERDFGTRFEAWDAGQTGHGNVKEVLTPQPQPQAPKVCAASQATATAPAPVDGANPEAEARPLMTRESFGLCVDTMHEQSCTVWFQEQAKKRSSRRGLVSGRIAPL